MKSRRRINKQQTGTFAFATANGVTQTIYTAVAPVTLDEPQIHVMLNHITATIAEGDNYHADVLLAIGSLASTVDQTSTLADIARQTWARDCDIITKYKAPHLLLFPHTARKLFDGDKLQLIIKKVATTDVSVNSFRYTVISSFWELT